MSVPSVVSIFKAKAHIAADNAPAGLDCTLIFAGDRVRIEALGGWSVTRSDLGVRVDAYIASKPPQPKVYNEPPLTFNLPPNATLEGEETVNGKHCSRYSFPVSYRSMQANVKLWVTSGGANGKYLPVQLRQESSNSPDAQIIRLSNVEEHTSFPDELFAIEQYIPHKRHSTITMRRLIKDHMNGAQLPGVTVCCSHT